MKTHDSLQLWVRKHETQSCSESCVFSFFILVIQFYTQLYTNVYWALFSSVYYINFS